MFVDIGAKSREEAQPKVKVGEMAVFAGPLQEMGGRVASKALDDRVGCALLVQLIKEVKNSPNELIFVFTVQEEVGRRGASPTTFGITPDAGLAVDVTPVGDTPESVRRTVSLGAGPAIKVMDAGHIVPPIIRDWMLDTATREGIAHQREVLEGGATDAGMMQATGEGVPSGVLSVPCRYVHTPSEMVDLDDVANSLRLLTSLVTNPLPTQLK
jgi:endoglucanase